MFDASSICCHWSHKGLRLPPVLIIFLHASTVKYVGQLLSGLHCGPPNQTFGPPHSPSPIHAEETACGVISRGTEASCREAGNLSSLIAGCLSEHRLWVYDSWMAPSDRRIEHRFWPMSFVRYRHAVASPARSVIPAVARYTQCPIHRFLPWSTRGIVVLARFSRLVLTTSVYQKLVVVKLMDSMLCCPGVRLPYDTRERRPPAPNLG